MTMTTMAMKKRLLVCCRSSTPSPNPRHLTQLLLLPNLVNHLKAMPLATAALATDLPNFLLYIAEVHPAHLDHVLQAVPNLDQHSVSSIDQQLGFFSP